MRWLKQLFTRGRRYNELSESIRERLDEMIADLMDHGMKREEAERTACRPGSIAFSARNGCVAKITRDTKTLNVTSVQATTGFVARILTPCLERFVSQ
jgi:hypothetical protein